MPYPYLPDDFEKQYRSVYIDIPSELFDPELGHIAYNDYLDEMEYAGSLGFDGVCMNEHHYNAYGLMPSRTSWPRRWRDARRTPGSSCSATASRCTTRRHASLRSSRCST